MEQKKIGIATELQIERSLNQIKKMHKKNMKNNNNYKSIWNKTDIFEKKIDFFHDTGVSMSNIIRLPSNFAPVIRTIENKDTPNMHIQKNLLPRI